MKLLLRKHLALRASALPEVVETVRKFSLWRTKMFRAFPTSKTARAEGLLEGNETFCGMLEDPAAVHIHVRSPRKDVGTARSVSESFRISARQSQALWQAGNSAFPRLRYEPGEFAHVEPKLLQFWGTPPHTIVLQTTTHVRGRVDNVSVFVLRRSRRDERWSMFRMYLLDAHEQSVAHLLGRQSLLGDGHDDGHIERTLPAIASAKNVSASDLATLGRCHDGLLSAPSGFRRGTSRRLNTSARFARAMRKMKAEVDTVAMVSWVDACLMTANPSSLAAANKGRG